MTNNELLRKLVPGVKAEYEVKNITFPNLIAFLVAKVVNESVGCMIIDYEKIFENGTFPAIESTSEISMDNSIETAIDDIKNNLNNSIVSSELFGKYNLRLLNNLILNISDLIISIINTYCTNDGLKYLSDNNIYYAGVIGIGFYDINDIDHNSESKDAKNLFISKIPSLVNEVIKYVLEVNSKCIVSQQQNNTTNISTTIPPFQPVEQVATTTPKVDLVGWSDIKPGIMDTEQPVHQPTGDPKYDQLSEQDKTIVDGFVGMMMDVNKMKQNPHAFEAQVNELKATINQATSNSQQQTSQPTVNIDVTKAPDGCNCGHEHCNCGNN